MVIAGFVHNEIRPKAHSTSPPYELPDYLVIHYITKLKFCQITSRMVNTKQSTVFSILAEKRDSSLISLHKEFCEFCLLEKGYSQETIKCYWYSLNSLLKYFQLEKIQDINEGIIRQFFNEGRKERNLSNNAILHHRKNMSPFFNWCVKKGYLSENPFNGIEKPKMESKIPQFYLDEEIEKIMYFIQEYRYQSKFLRKRNYAIMAMFLMAGLRKGELLGLKLMDVNLEQSTITVRGASSKSKRDRIIPLSQRLKDILAEYLNERKKLNKTTLSFFASYTHNMGLTEEGMKHLLLKLQKETGIHIYAHKFRHTFATKSLESDMNINTVKELLGHKDIKTTAIYLHTTVKHLKKEIEKSKMNCMI